MWMFIVISFAFAQVTWAESGCSRNEDCVYPDLFRFVPVEISEYNKLCPQLPALIRCLKDYQDECGTEDARIFASEEEYESMYHAFSELCDEGTLFNTVVTGNLRCLNDTFSKTTCPEEMKAITGSYRSPLEETEDEDDYQLPIEVMCLQDILESNCIAADIGKKCGETSMEAALEFIRRTFYIEDTCGKKVAEAILKNLDEYNLDLQQRALVIVTLEKIILSA